MQKQTVFQFLSSGNGLETFEVFQQWNEEAMQAFQRIVGTDINALKEQSLPKYHYFLNRTYQATCLHPSKEITHWFKEQGFKRMHLQWFIALEEVLQAINHITEGGEIKLFKKSVLLLIKAHLEIKISALILRFAGFTASHNDKPFATNLKKDLANIYRRKDYAEGLPLKVQGEYDQLMNALIEELEQVAGDKEEARRNLLQISDGNTKKTFLKMMVQCCEHNPGTDAFYRRFFPLFQLICPDENLMSKEEFINYTTSKGEHSPYLAKSYNSYMAKRVRDLIR
jgi:hypothetical protein